MSRSNTTINNAPPSIHIKHNLQDRNSHPLGVLYETISSIFIPILINGCCVSFVTVNAVFVGGLISANFPSFVVIVDFLRDKPPFKKTTNTQMDNDDDEIVSLGRLSESEEDDTRVELNNDEEEEEPVQLECVSLESEDEAIVLPPKTTKLGCVGFCFNLSLALFFVLAVVGALAGGYYIYVSYNAHQYPTNCLQFMNCTGHNMVYCFAGVCTMDDPLHCVSRLGIGVSATMACDIFTEGLNVMGYIYTVIIFLTFCLFMIWTGILFYCYKNYMRVILCINCCCKPRENIQVERFELTETVKKVQAIF